MKRLNVRKLFNTRKKKLIAGLILLLVAGGIAYALKKGEVPVVDAPVPGMKYHSQLTGNEVSKEESERPLLAVMIENSEEARPQTGLDAAGIVFETTTEAGITRYMALYQENMPDEVGPIRSARVPFVNWAMGFDASYAHYGGAAEALELLERRNAKNFDGRTDEKTFYRVNSRTAPHNVYAKLKDIVALQDKAGHKTSKMKEFPRSDDAPAAEAKATSITVNFSVPLFQAKFVYDRTTNSYGRILAGEPHMDAKTDKQITVKNVVVIRMQTADIDAIGSGRGILYKDGAEYDIRWKQSSYANRIELSDENGNEIKLNRGDTWFAVVPASGSVVSTSE